LDVEFAPFQKIPREKQRKDPKVGTIDRDPDFVAFLEALSKPNEVRPQMG
jgi:regulator of nonsense transcripts 3